MSEPAESRLVTMPSPGSLGRRVALHLGEAVLIPLGIFYGVEELFGLWPGLLAALGWAALAITVHLVRGGRPSALLIATGAFAAVQIAVTALVGSALLYYLQPTIVTFGFSAVLAATAHRRTPLIERLAADFCPLPEVFLDAPEIRRFFRRLSWLWAGVLGLNAAGTLAWLLTTSTTLAVPLATATSVPVFVLGLGLSYRDFTRAVAAGGFVLVWGERRS